jgi:hypothetical protein
MSFYEYPTERIPTGKHRRTSWQTITAKGYEAGGMSTFGPLAADRHCRQAASAVYDRPYRHYCITGLVLSIGKRPLHYQQPDVQELPLSRIRSSAFHLQVTATLLPDRHFKHNFESQALRYQQPDVFKRLPSRAVPFTCR